MNTTYNKPSLEVIEIEVEQVALCDSLRNVQSDSELATEFD